MRKLAVVLLMALVVTAGCTTGGADGSTTTTDDGSGDGPSAGTTTSLPDWASESGVDLEALASSHVDAMLSASSYTYRMNQSTVENGTSRGVLIVREVDFESGRVYLRQATGPSDGRTVDEAFFTGERVHSRTSTGSGTEYSTTARPDDAPPITDQLRTDIESREGYRTWLAAWSFSPDGTVERGGVEFLRFTATAFNESRTEFSLAADAQAEATLLVTRDGRIREFVQRFHDGSGENETRIRFQVTDVGATTVAEPSWTDRAAEESGGS